MSVPRFSVSQPVLVNLVAVSMTIIGAVTLAGMHRESLPTMPTGWGAVITYYPGASPEEVEQLITIPLENAVAATDNIDELWSTSREGQSYLNFKFDDSVKDVPRAIMEVSNEINRVNDLPTDADRPIVREIKVDYPTLAVAIRGEVPEEVLREVGKELADDIERISGVAGIWRNGIRDREIRVQVDPDRLAAYHLPLTSVTEALQLRAANIPAGTTSSARDARLVRGMTRVDTAQGIADVVIRPDARGGAVVVGDVAEVNEVFAEARLSGSINGEHGIVLTVKKEEQADSIRISERVHSLLERVRPSLPPGVSVETFGDASEEVNRSLDTLYANAFAGLLLVLALLWFFVGARNATMAALGLPVALAGAIAAMHAMGITINVISLLALILCLGIVVDDAIIIIENIYRHMEEGMPRRQAAILGTKEVFWPVIASTLTTWAAFLPMLLMSGTLGKFFAIIPKVVVASLAASLIEAMFILPSHMAEFGKLVEKKGAANVFPETRLDRLSRRVIAGYERLLRWSLAHRWSVIAGAYTLCALMLGTTYLAKDIILFSEGDVDMFDVRVHMPTDASKQETEAILNDIERRVLSLNNPDLEATVGVRGLVRAPMGVDRGDHTGMVSVFVVPARLRSSLRGGQELMQQANALFDDIVGPQSLEVVEVRPGPPRGAPVAVRVQGDDHERLADLADQVLAEVREIPGTRNANSNYELGKQELQIRVDEQRAALHGITPAVVAAWLRSAFGASPAATLRDGSDEIDIVVELTDEAQQDASQIAALRLIAADGSDIALREIADLEHGRGPGAIRRHERKRQVSVLSYVDEDVTNASAVNRELQERIAGLVAANPDIRFEYGGQYEETQESVQSLLQAFVIAILLIYTILATQFQSFSQPLVVMAAIPLAFIGVTLGFLLSTNPVDLIALVGVVGLAGIVVNDSLVLVDFINTRRREGMALDEAIVTAGKLRLRPIFLTSITTIAGLLPLALSGEATAFLSPMAAVIVWGLTFSTVLTLICVPCLYRADIDLAERLSKRFAPLKRWLTDPGAATVEADSSAE